MTKSTFSKGVRMPGSFFTGRKLAYKFSALRNATLMLRWPTPIGVVRGPFKPTRVRMIAFTTGSASVSSCRRPTMGLASISSQVISAPAAASRRTVARDTSGPIPSPGISVTVGAIVLDSLQIAGHQEGKYFSGDEYVVLPITFKALPVSRHCEKAVALYPWVLMCSPQRESRWYGSPFLEIKRRRRLKKMRRRKGAPLGQKSGFFPGPRRFPNSDKESTCALKIRWPSRIGIGPIERWKEKLWDQQKVWRPPLTTALPGWPPPCHGRCPIGARCLPAPRS